MESSCVYEQKRVINELTQGIEMAKQLRINLNSAEARQFFIQKILSSYEDALMFLKSGDSGEQPRAAALSVPSLPPSTLSIGSPQRAEFEFDHFDQPFMYQQDQNVVSKTRKAYTIDEIANKRDHISPEKHEINPIVHYNHQNQQQQQQELPPIASETLSNLRANLSVNTYDMSGSTVPSSFSFPSTNFGLVEEYQQLHFLNPFDDELLQVYSPPFISTDTSSESNYSTDWGSSPSYELPADPEDIFPDFLFDNSVFHLEGSYI